MSSQQTFPIDNELFQFYIHYQLRLVRKSMLLWGDNSEKDIIVNILNNCQHVEGNTLRTIINEIFDNSILKRTHHKDKSQKTTDDVVVFNGRNTNTKQSAVSTDEDGEPLYLDSSHEEPRIKKAKTSITSTQTSTKFKMENSKGKREISKLLERVLNQDASKEINCMVKYKERSRYVFHTRMKTLRDSFKINYTFPGENSSPSTPNCTFEVFKLFDNRSILGQCQLNLTSYRLGKLREKEEQVLPITTVRNNYEKYHSSLRESLDNPTLSYREYARYCKILVKVVERLGAYPLFFPEILPPSTFKKVAQDDFSKIQDYFDELFSEFRDIARFDDNDDLILTESAGSSNYSDEKDAYHSRFLKNE